MLNYAAAFENTGDLSLGTIRLSRCMPLCQVTCHLPIDDAAVATDIARANYRAALLEYEYGAYDYADVRLRIAARRMAELGLEHWSWCLGMGCSVPIHGEGYCEDCQLAPFDTIAMRRMTLSEELDLLHCDDDSCLCQEDAA